MKTTIAIILVAVAMAACGGAVQGTENRACRAIIYDCDDSELGIDDGKLLSALSALGMDCEDVEVDAVVCLEDSE